MYSIAYIKSKRLLFLVLSIFSLSFLTGCMGNSNSDLNEIVAPTVNKLSIEGKWEIVKSIVLEPNLLKDNSNLNYEGKYIQIVNNGAEIVDKQYKGVTCKVKIVGKDYQISYDKNFTINDLNIDSKEIKVFTANYKQSILYEFFYGDESRSYIYYFGILFEVKKAGNADEDLSNYIEQSVEEAKEDIDMSEGLYLGLKTPTYKDKEGNYTPESYRTLWISLESGELQPIEERQDILFPRMKGIWTLNKKVTMKEGIYNESFVVNPLDSKEYTLDISADKNVHSTLNFVGNDYIAIETYEGENFEGIYTKFEILPIDNIQSEKSLFIQDIFTKEANAIYKSDYEEAMKAISNEEKNKLEKFINYSNFSLERNNGRWDLIGRVSPAVKGAKPLDYPLSLKPNKKLLNYDTLIIPWKVLRGQIPLISDAYTSPEGTMAIIIQNNLLQIYKMSKGQLIDTPLATIKLKEGEEVIMAEWCGNDYVDRWYKAFSTNSKIIN